MKPFKVDLNKGSPKRVFNYRLSRARRIVENSFGLMASVFRIFRKPMELKLDNIIDVTLCCVYLHNFLRKSVSSRSRYAPFGCLDSEDINSREIILGSWREITENDTGLRPLVNIARRPSLHATNVRDEYLEYFMSDMGSVAWQHKYLN